MRRREYLPAVIDGELTTGSSYQEPRRPIKLKEKQIAKRLVEVLGFTFFDTGYALACPNCGKVSGISMREDIDGQVDWFLKFGCTCYNKKK